MLAPDASSEPPTIPEVVKAIAAPLTIAMLEAFAAPEVARLETDPVKATPVDSIVEIRLL